MSFLTAFQRRRTERDVRIHPEARDLPGRSATPHRRPRGAAPALHQIEVEAPVWTPPAPGYVFAASTLGGMRADIGRFRAEAADLEMQANDFLGRASRLRLAAADFEQFLRLAAVPVADGPQLPLGDDYQGPAVAGDPCYGCGRSRDTLPCWNALEGRAVPLCPRCHPSMGAVDEWDGEEPEWVEPEPVTIGQHKTLHAGNDFLLPVCEADCDPSGSVAVIFNRELVTCPACLAILDAPGAGADWDMANADAVWHAEHPGECCPNFATCPDCSTAAVAGVFDGPELPERLTSGPGAVPEQAEVASRAAGRDVFRYFVPGSIAQRAPFEVADGEAVTAVLPVIGDTVTVPRVDGGEQR